MDQFSLMADLGTAWIELFQFWLRKQMMKSILSASGKFQV